MDRINIQCLLSGKDINLQLDRKSMPGETGPCFMMTANGHFKGYISRQNNGSYKFLGEPYYTDEHLKLISEHLRKNS